jgi:hypothetical protein
MKRTMDLCGPGFKINENTFQKKKQLIETYSKESTEEIFSRMGLTNYCID